MPLYEYECGQCGNIMEALQKFSDTPLTTCGKCSGQLHRIVSQSSFHLKGSGWYVTDYANKSQNTSTEKKPDTSSEKPKSAEKSSD